MAKPTKPTGIIQRAVITPDSFDVRKLEFPRSKEKIESLIAQLYADNCNSQEISVSIDKQNEIDNLDFEATFMGNPASLELTEIAPLSNGGFDKVDDRYEILKFARSIERLIRKKIIQCAAETMKQKLLLLYTTDYRFEVVPKVLKHLQYLFHNGDHGFSRIDVITPRANNTADFAVIYPAKQQDWSEYDPEKLGDELIVFADLSRPLPNDQWPGNK